MASGDGACAGAALVQHRSMLPIISNCLTGWLDMSCFLRRMITGPPVSGAASRCTWFAGRRCKLFTRIDEQDRDLADLIQQPREPNHAGNAAEADEQLHQDAMGVLNQYPVRAKGQEYPETKQRKRMLAAQHQRTQPFRGKDF